MIEISSCRAAIIVTSLLLLVSACSSDKKEKEQEEELTWKCWANTSNGICECIGLGPLEDHERAGSSIEEVDDCNGREVCFTYFDEAFENEVCACGDSTFVPVGDDVSDLDMVDSCPPQ